MTTPLRVHGVDISHHQNNRIGWAALKEAGVQWMYHKATEGLTLRDGNYARRREEAKAAKMPFGAYHFARPSGNDARGEAQFFINVAKPVPGDLRPCLDLETKQFVDGLALLRWAEEFCDEVEKLARVKPIIYTPFSLSSAVENRYYFWVPRYNNDNRPPTRPWDIFQFSNGQLGVPNSVPGLGHVDLNHSKIGLDALLIKRDRTLTSRGVRVDRAIKDLKSAERLSREGTHKDKLLDQALAVLNRIKKIR